MKRRSLLLPLIALAALGVGVLFFASTLSLSTLQPPGKAETYLATRAKWWLVARSSREPLPAAPRQNEMSATTGFMHFGKSCASCHGQDGLTPTRIGSSMYPPAPALGSPEVQRYSDAELFIVIKHGIRFTGMPGFANIHSEEEIWHLVRYVRSLGPAPR